MLTTGRRVEEKAARIANTRRSTAGKRGGKSPSYEDWSKEELQDRARELGIEGRSKWTKASSSTRSGTTEAPPPLQV
jgi:hypothetical protein